MPSTTTKTPYGYKSVFTGYFTPEEAHAWFEDVKRAVAGKRQFGQLIDVRGQSANPPETNAVIQEAMAYVRQQGMQRSAVVLSSALITMQIKRLAKQTGMDAWERYIDASANPNWERAALAWIEKGVDPDA